MIDALGTAGPVYMYTGFERSKLFGAGHRFMHATGERAVASK